jgi:selenocysteine lyase/cysteine desulfurase
MSGARTGPQSDEAPDHTSPGEDPGETPTGMLDELRRAQYSRLDAGGHVYLDYAGGGLYAESQLREHFELLRGGVFGNPHSLNPTSAASTALLERARAGSSARARVLQSFAR